MSSIPIWVTDPTGNNNPFLKIQPNEAFLLGDGLTGEIWRSRDGLNWTMTYQGVFTFFQHGVYTGGVKQINTPGNPTMSGLGQNCNGAFVVTGIIDLGGLGVTGGVIGSKNGTDWEVITLGTNGDAQSTSSVVSFDFGTNIFTITGQQSGGPVTWTNPNAQGSIAAIDELDASTIDGPPVAGYVNVMGAMTSAGPVYLSGSAVHPEVYASTDAGVTWNVVMTLSNAFSKCVGPVFQSVGS